MAAHLIFTLENVSLVCAECLQLQNLHVPFYLVQGTIGESGGNDRADIRRVRFHCFYIYTSVLESDDRYGCQWSRVRLWNSKRKGVGAYLPKQSCRTERWVCNICQSITPSKPNRLAPHGELSVTNTPTLSFTGALWSRRPFHSVPATYHLPWSLHPESGESIVLTCLRELLLFLQIWHQFEKYIDYLHVVWMFVC